jgi:hypothetical protein
VVVVAVIIDYSFVVGEGGRGGGDQGDQSSLNLMMKSLISISWCK